MFSKILGVVFLAALVVAEIPSYIKVCGRRNPNLNKCVLNSVSELHDRFKIGMPELDVPSAEPLVLDGFPLSETEQLHAYARNVKLHGLWNYDTKSVKVDLEKQTLDIEVLFKQIILDAILDIKAKIIIQIADRGLIHITSDDIDTKVALKYKLFKKNGTEYLFFTSMTTSLNVKDYNADYKPSTGLDSTVATAINAAINGGRQEILDSIRPTLERVISEEVLEIANKICTHFTYDELYPDRE